MRELFANPLVRQSIGRAFQIALPSPPSATDLIRMARGYEQHARLIGSPLGHLVASEAAKDAARPKFLFGVWGDFATLLDRAVAHTIPVLDAAWRACQDVAAERSLRDALPPGSIDELDDRVRLDSPFEIVRPSTQRA